MGKTKHDRHIHFHYTDKFVAFYKEQPQEYKDKWDEAGRPFGYTAMNMCYVIMRIACVKESYDLEYKDVLYNP